MNQTFSVFFGVFDGIHANTVEMFLRLKTQLTPQQPVMAVVLSEEEAKQALGIEPILPLQERCELLQSLQCVGAVSEARHLEPSKHWEVIQTPETPAILKLLKLEHLLQNPLHPFPISEAMSHHLLLKKVSNQSPLQMLKTQAPLENILNEQEALRLCQQFDSKTLVTTNGSFDWLHLGHVRYLQQAKEQGDVLMVLVNSDESVRERKGTTRPIFSLQSRLKTLACLKAVDYVLPFFGDTPLNMLSLLKPHLHIKGGSYEKERVLEEQQLLESWGGEFQTLPMVGNFSSSKFLQTLKEKSKKLSEIKRKEVK